MFLLQPRCDFAKDECLGFFGRQVVVVENFMLRIWEKIVTHTPSTPLKGQKKFFPPICWLGWAIFWYFCYIFFALEQVLALDGVFGTTKMLRQPSLIFWAAMFFVQVGTQNAPVVGFYRYSTPTVWGSWKSCHECEYSKCCPQKNIYFQLGFSKVYWAYIYLPTRRCLVTCAELRLALSN